MSLEFQTDLVLIILPPTCKLINFSEPQSFIFEMVVENRH